MQRLVAGLFALTLMLEPAAAAARPKPQVIAQPDWLATPDGAVMSRVFPKLPQELEIEGSATIACKVTDLGALVDCEVAREAPAGLGFGAAALALAPTFRMRPMQVDGRPTSDGTVRVPINFRLPVADPTPPLVFAPKSAAHLQAATEVFQVVGAKRGDHIRQRADRLEFLVEGADQEKLSAAAAAFRASAKVFEDHYLAAGARVYAELFTEQELRDWRDFLKSPGGRLQMHDPNLSSAQAKLRSRVNARLGRLAREGFCRRFACVNDLDLLRIGRFDEDVTVQAARFSEGPDDTALWYATPPLAKAMGVSGVVRLACRVTGEGLLAGCVARDEAPKGMGFGAAAVSLAPTFRIAGDQVAQGAAGELVNVFIPFEIPQLDEGEEWGPEPTAANRALASQLIEHFTIGDQTDRFERRFPPSPDQAPEARGAAKAALEEANVAADAYWLDQSIRIMGSSYSETQLRGALAFRAGPVGQKQRANREKLYELLRIEDDRASRDAYAEARRIFCASHGCAAETPQTAVSPPSTR